MFSLVNVRHHVVAKPKQRILCLNQTTLHCFVLSNITYEYLKSGSPSCNEAGNCPRHLNVESRKTRVFGTKCTASYRFTIEKETEHKITKLIRETWVSGFTHKKSIYTQRQTTLMELSKHSDHANLGYNTQRRSNKYQFDSVSFYPGLWCLTPLSTLHPDFHTSENIIYIQT